MNGLNRTAVGLALCLTALIAMPTNSCARDNANAADEIVKLEIAEDTSVLDLIKQVSKLLDVQIITSRDKMLVRKINGAPTFEGSRDRVFGHLRSLLVAYEIVLLPIGDPKDKRFIATDARHAGAIMKLRPESIDIREANLTELETQAWRFVTTTLHVAHLDDLRNVRTALAKLVTGSSIGQITEAPPANAMVITDFAPNVVAAYRLIRQLDVKPRTPQHGLRVAVIQIKHAKAHDIAVLATGIKSTPQSRVRPGQTNSLRVAADARTNQVVVSGDASAVRKVEAMIEKLDVALPKQPASAPTSTKVTTLQHQRATEAAEVLIALFRNSGSKLVADAPKIVAMHSRNALLVAGTDKAHALIAELVAQLDTPLESPKKAPEKAPTAK